MLFIVFVHPVHINKTLARQNGGRSELKHNNIGDYTLLTGDFNGRV